MIHEIWWSLPLTLAVYFAARWLARKLNMPLLNPLLVSMAVIIPLLLFTGIPYERYFQGSKILNDLLQPAVVALAFPLYEQLHQIRARWSGPRYSRSPGLTSKAGYQASMLRTTPLTRNFSGEWGSTAKNISAVWGRVFMRHACAQE